MLINRNGSFYVQTSLVTLVDGRNIFLEYYCENEWDGVYNSGYKLYYTRRHARIIEVVEAEPQTIREKITLF